MIHRDYFQTHQRNESALALQRYRGISGNVQENKLTDTLLVSLF